MNIPFARLLEDSTVLERDFYSRPAIDVARDCLGKILVHGKTAGRIVEVEAYLGVTDRAAHAWRGVTERTRVIFGEPGHAYVYFIYGCWYALNVSAEASGIGAGVLIRGLEPIEGIDLMQRHRGVSRLFDLTRGPGRLAMALDIDRRLDGTDLCADGPLWLAAAVRRVGAVGESVRIGITREVDRKLRFFERDNGHVSGPARLRA